jgi:hypothetical protein
MGDPQVRVVSRRSHPPPDDSLLPGTVIRHLTSIISWNPPNFPEIVREDEIEF